MLYYFIFISLLIGAVIGSFTNCFIWRLYKDETLLNRSYCPNCRKMIAWFDNVPVISFFLLKMRCRQCGKKISWQYPLVEISTALLFSLSFYLLAKQYLGGVWNSDELYLLSGNGFVLSLAKYWLVIFILTVIFVYDCRWYLIPDKVAIPGALLLVFLNVVLGYDWLTVILCSLIGCCFFLAQFLVSRGKWVGGGDIRLGFLMGAITGIYSDFLLATLLTYCFGSLVGILLVFFGKREWSSKVPLAVFASPALLATLFFGKQIISWYLGLF
jgi:prepilin signal peptidase PulO-like enzyme (type II secretory pathway)